MFIAKINFLSINSLFIIYHFVKNMCDSRGVNNIINLKGQIFLMQISEQPDNVFHQHRGNVNTEFIYQSGIKILLNYRSAA